MIGFPGIGWEFQRNPIIFRIGENFALNWYAVILVTGLLLAVTYCLRQVKHFGIKHDEVYDMLFCAVPAAIIGARLYYVAFNWENYSANPITMLYTWRGGIAIYGAIIGAVIAAVVFCRVRRVNAGAMLDLGAMGLLIGQAIGRWGNFVNSEIYGMETTVPWRISQVDIYGNSVGEVHPLFLYESLWNIAGFILLRCLMMKNRKYNGQMFTFYVAWYGLGRAMLEGMRNPEFNLTAGGAMWSQVFAIVTCIAATVLLFYMTIFKKHRPLLEWTVARDEYEELRQAKKGGEKTIEDTAEEKEAAEEEGTEENGGNNGREDLGEEDKDPDAEGS